jgi:hypothetical protein
VGGSITFNYGAALVTIMLSNRDTVTVDTLIDGGTLSIESAPVRARVLPWKCQEY